MKIESKTEFPVEINFFRRHFQIAEKYMYREQIKLITDYNNEWFYYQQKYYFE